MCVPIVEVDMSEIQGLVIKIPVLIFTAMPKVGGSTALLVPSREVTD